MFLRMLFLLPGLAHFPTLLCQPVSFALINHRNPLVALLCLHLMLTLYFPSMTNGRITRTVYLSNSTVTLKNSFLYQLAKRETKLRIKNK